MFTTAVKPSFVLPFSVATMPEQLITCMHSVYALSVCTQCMHSVYALSGVFFSPSFLDCAR